MGSRKSGSWGASLVRNLKAVSGDTAFADTAVVAKSTSGELQPTVEGVVGGVDMRARVFPVDL